MADITSPETVSAATVRLERTEAECMEAERTAAAGMGAATGANIASLLSA
jgi:hypothetical protein